MRVLITGVTARMIGSTRLHYKYLSNVSLIEKALRLAGHSVTTRKTDLGANYADDYDIALVGMAKIHSLGAGYFPEACEILRQFEDRAILYADDWSIVGLGEGLRGALKDFSVYLKWRKYPWDQEYLDNMEEQLRKIAFGKCRWPVMLPIFGWGNPEKFIEGNITVDPDDLLGFDPTNLYDMPIVPIKSPSEKVPQWIHAALGKHDAWLKKLKLTWDVVQFGNKREGQLVLSEEDVVAMYGKSWGVLASKYPKAGFGWWRVRYVHAARTGCVMLCDPEDGKVIGSSYCIPASEIESMSNAQLYDLARYQRDQLFSHIPLADDVVKQIDDFVVRYV